MLRTIWIGFTRGLLLGLIGGLLAGGIEALSIIRDAPSARAALNEAALYAIVVNGLACAGITAVIASALAVVLRLMRRQVSARTGDALFVSAAAVTTMFAVGSVWAFRANGADRSAGIPLPQLFLILVISLGFGAVVQWLARGYATALLSSVRRVATLGIVGTIVLGAVFPVQVVLEARESASMRDETVDAMQPADVDALQVDPSVDLTNALAMRFVRRGARPQTEPNVLLITVDALRADHLGFCGNDEMRTPWLDMLASYSVVSCTTYTEQPQTNPALASLMTSTYPAVNGVRRHMVDRLSDSFDTLAKELKRHGFTTAAVLPWTSLEPAFSGFQQGFETYEAFVLNEPEAMKNPATAALAGVYRRVTEQVALGGAVESVLGMRQGTEAEIDGRADLSASATISWLKSHGDEHFFLWVHFFDPHYPWTAPEPWDQLYDGGRDYDGPYDGGMGFVYEMRAGVFNPTPRDVEFLRAMYASEVSYTDHYIGQVLGYMGRQGMLDNTIVVVTADHGESLGERGTSWTDGMYWLHGDDVYTPGIQVPLVIYDPRSTRGHQVLTAPIQHIDIMPTILDLLDLPRPAQAQGRSIVPLMRGAEDGSDRVAITVLGDDSQVAINAADGWKLIVNRETGERELYNIDTDPKEARNLITDAPLMASALERRLDSWAQANHVAVAIRSSDDAGGL
ncbi:MAG TPA: sulfatase [Chloroflexota bacterium]|nr:sulfatase [Chloroflexota bacterium]